MKKVTTSEVSRKARFLVYLCVVVYFASYITRKNYAAIMVEFINSTGITKDGASLAITGLAIFYGAGQILSGFLGDKIKPKYLIAAGLFTSSAMNLALPFCSSSVPLLAVVWSINGLAQAMMWPPIVRLLALALSGDDYKKATVKVSYGSQSATILLYLLSPICITYSGWKPIFFFSAAFAAVMAVIVLLFTPNVVYEKKVETPVVSAENEPKPALDKKAFPFALVGFIMIAIILQGMIRDGVADWLPTYLENEYEISSQLAILLGVAPSIFAMICYELVSFLSRKILKNELFFSGVIFGVGFAASALLAVFYSKSIVLSVVLSTIATGSMHGVNLILICLLPHYFKNTGKISLVSGVLNSCTYVGSALSGYGFAKIATIHGWQGTIIGWAIICAVACVICLGLVKSWKKFKASNS